MNINAQIIDQRLESVKDSIRERAKNELNLSDEAKLKSLAFVALSIKTVLDLSDDETFDCLTEGGQDFGVDGVFISEERDNEFMVNLFQGKYERSLDGNSNFEEKAIRALINAIRHLFDPSSELENIDQRLKFKIEEIRSLVRDGYIPQVRAIACNNGLSWNQATQELIDLEKFGDQVSFEHINHDSLIRILQAPKRVSDTMTLQDKAIVEDFNFSRVMLGRVPITEIHALIERHGEQLLERNIRRYLGLQGNRVNEAIRDTLLSSDSSNFYFYNNGITLTCDRFTHNALQQTDYQVKIENLQIINGGQTCMTIHKTLTKNPDMGKDAYVLVRLYQLPSDKEDLVQNITFATNSQNPVDLRDLRSNDDKQRTLETDITQLGYSYRRKRADNVKANDITIQTVAEAVLSIWRQKPHQGKFFTREHFGKLYTEIFSPSLNGSQAIIAVLLYRIAENKRKRPVKGAENHELYASCFIAMQMGIYLLKEMGIPLEGLDHRNFQNARSIISNKGENLFTKASADVKTALVSLYGNNEVSLQQLSATFRRGDLIEKMLEIGKLNA